MEIDMSKKIIELQEKRLKAVHDARSLFQSTLAPEGASDTSFAGC
jgi:hypothetical protein